MEGFDFTESANENNGYTNLVGHMGGIAQRKRGNQLQQKQIQIAHQLQKEIENQRYDTLIIEEYQNLLFDHHQEIKSIANQFETEPVMAYYNLYSVHKSMGTIEMNPDIFPSLEWKQFCSETLGKIDEIYTWAQENISEEHHQAALQLIEKDRIAIEQKELEEQKQKKWLNQIKWQKHTDSTAFLGFLLSCFPFLCFWGLSKAIYANKLYKKLPDKNGMRNVTAAIVLNVLWIVVIIIVGTTIFFTQMF